MKFTSLGSGSAGNALVVESGKTRIMIDCGFSLRETTRRLSLRGLTPDGIHAIFITHEHSDHIGGAAKFAQKYGTPIHLTHGTCTKLNGDAAGLTLRLIDGNATVSLGDLAITPFPVPHDAREPVQYLIGDGKVKLAVLTDLGHATACVKSHVDGVDALILEANHDLGLLAANKRYPESIKARIRGDYGHLNNRQAAELLKTVDVSRLRHIVAAHLSEQNNRSDIARQTLAAALGCEENWVGVAEQGSGFDWREL